MKPSDAIRRDIAGGSRFMRNVADFKRRQSGIRPYSEREMAEAIEMRRRWNPQRKCILTAFESSQVAPSSQAAFYGPNKLRVSVDFALAAWNTVAAHRLFTLTGTVALKLFAVIRTSLTSGGAMTIQLGVTTATTVWIGATAVATMTGPDTYWVGVSGSGAQGDQGTAGLIPMVKFVASGAQPFHIGYELLVAAATGGTMEFIAYWEPVSSNGNLVAASGGAL
jgi:hypothetical protein